MTSDPPPRRPRTWYAIGFATVLMFFSYVLTVFAFAAASNDETVFAGGVLGVALGLVPAVFACAAAVSNRPRPLRATALAVVVWVIIGFPVAVIDIPSGLVAGFGAGGMVALRRSPTSTTMARIVAVAACTLYVFVLQWLLAPAGLLVGAVLPLAAIGIADAFTEREAGTGDAQERATR